MAASEMTRAGADEDGFLQYSASQFNVLELNFSS
jgi:hypothetical protein